MKKLCLLYGSLIIAFMANNVHAQDTIKNKRNLVVGYSTNINLGSNPISKNKPFCCLGYYTQGMYLRRYINQHIALETSLFYYKSYLPSVIPAKSLGLTIPLSAQYYLLPKKKLRPYFGIGVTYTSQQAISPEQPGTDKTLGTTRSNKVAIQYDQGILYQVNTKIEIKESIHIIPEIHNTCSGFGLELGIGFNL